MGLHGGRRTTSTAMIDRREKLHRADLLSFCSYSAFCAYAATAAAAAMMFRIGGRKEVTDLAWRLRRRRLGSRPPWSEGVCLLANLPSKNTRTTLQLRLLMRCNQNGQQRPPWCPSTRAGAYNSRSECWLIIICGGAWSEAPWRM